MITKIPHLVKFENNFILTGYRCMNGASHDDFCCGACWNRHPNPKLHLPKFSTKEARLNYDKYKKQYNLPEWLV